MHPGSFRLTSPSPAVINKSLDPFNPDKTALPMIATCIDNLIAALADMPTPPGLAIPCRDILQDRLETMQRVTICLRPGDTYRYRVLALLFRLPDLRPGPRAVLLNQLLSNLDLFQAETERCISPEFEEPLSAEPPSNTDSPHPPQQVEPVPETPAPASSPPPDTGSFSATARREDLFDRFLGWISSLVS